MMGLPESMLNFSLCPKYEHSYVYLKELAVNNNPFSLLTAYIFFLIQKVCIHVIGIFFNKPVLGQ